MVIDIHRGHILFILAVLEDPYQGCCPEYCQNEYDYD